MAKYTLRHQKKTEKSQSALSPLGRDGRRSGKQRRKERKQKTPDAQPKTCSGSGRNSGTKLALFAGVKRIQMQSSPQSGGCGAQTPPRTPAGPEQAGKSAREAGGSRRAARAGAEPARPGAAPRSSAAAGPGTQSGDARGPGGRGPSLPAGRGRPDTAEARGPSFVRRRGPLPLRVPPPRQSPALQTRPGPSSQSPGSGSRVGMGPTPDRASSLRTPAPGTAREHGEAGRRDAGSPSPAAAGLTCASAACQARGLRLALRPARPFECPRGRGDRYTDSSRCARVPPNVRPAPGFGQSLPPSPRSLPEAPAQRPDRACRAEAGRGRWPSRGGWALAQGSGRRLRAPLRRGRELGPELAAAAAAAAPSAGPAPGSGSRAPRSAPRLLPAPAAPRQPAPGAPPGRDPASHLPPQPARPLLLRPNSPGRVGSPQPQSPRTLTTPSPELDPVLREHLGTHRPAAAWDAQRSCTEPPAQRLRGRTLWERTHIVAFLLTSDTRTRFILL